MRIASVEAWQVPLPLREGRYSWSLGKSVAVFDSTLVRITADDGTEGWGECCPLGPVYLPAYGPGVRAGLDLVAPAVIGLDPREHLVVGAAMDGALKGHPYVKSALDVACWDLAGQAAGVPVVTLLGGRQGEAVPLYRAISQDTPERMAERVAHYRGQGYRRFQLKSGSTVADDIARIRAVRAVLDPADLLIADANTGWLAHEALRVTEAVRDLDVYIEQPCATLDECLAVRQRTAHPCILDEIITDLPALLRARAAGAMDAVNIKISKLGGLTRARQLRDACVELGLAAIVEDSWGGDVATAAIAHLAHSTPERFRLAATDFNSYVTNSVADAPVRGEGGVMRAPTSPGLGATPRPERLGEPVARWA